MAQMEKSRVGGGGAQRVAGPEGRAAAPCESCGGVVSKGLGFISPAPDHVFHRDCFNCDRCRGRIRGATLFNYAPDTRRLLCKLCHQAALSWEGEELQPLGPSFLACRSCTVPLTSAHGSAIVRGEDGEGGIWCRRCAVCRNCRLALKEGEPSVAVLDEIFCLRCVDVARLRRYTLSRMGSGTEFLRAAPPTTAPVSALPRSLNLSLASSPNDHYAVFNFQSFAAPVSGPRSASDAD